MQTSVEAPTPPATPIRDGTSPAAVYQAQTERARVLRSQLEGLIDERSEEISGLRSMSGGDMAPARAVVQERIARIDKRIAGIEEQIAQADAQVAASAAVPGATVPPPQRTDEADEAGLFFGGASFAIAMLLFYRYVFRRFIWRRKPRKGPFPENLQLQGELASRLERLESVAESTALEVERIGEGQRFVTKLLSEQKVPVQNKGV